jgi:hypothetical protein
MPAAPPEQFSFDTSGLPSTRGRQAIGAALQPLDLGLLADALRVLAMLL